MRHPSRPGDMVRLMLEEMDLSVTRAAALLGVTRQTLNNLLNKPTGSVSPEMAVRLAAVFGSTADHWLRMQAQYDAYRIRERAPEITRNLQRYEPGWA